MNTDSTEKTGELPGWKAHFPVSLMEDDFVSRREFTKSLGLISCATFVATSAVAMIAAARQRVAATHAARKIASLAQLPIGGSQVFFYPGPHDPCLLIRVSQAEIVAYGQKCTHLGCPVYYDPADGRIVCPCHLGFFSAESGDALAGPPKRPLPRIGLELRGDEVWTTGSIT